MATTLRVSIFRADPAGFHTQVINSLGTMSAQDRTIARGPGRRLLAIPHKARHGLSLWSLRNEDLSLHEKGKIHPWDLPADLAEGSYFQFHPHGYVAMVAPGHAPRTTALGVFVLDKFGENVSLDPVVRTNRGAHVASIDEVRRVEFNLTAHSIPVIREADDSLGRAIASVRAASGATAMKIILGGEDKETRDTMWARTGGAVRNLAARADLSALKGARVIVPGQLGGEEVIDLLKDRIGYQVEGTGGQLDEATAFGATTRAYTRFRAEFGNGASN